jgi:hypothetical protein
MGGGGGVVVLVVVVELIAMMRCLAPASFLFDADLTGS